MDWIGLDWTGLDWIGLVGLFGLIDWLFHRLVHWFIASFLHRFTDSWIHWLIDSSIHWFIDSFHSVVAWNLSCPWFASPQPFTHSLVHLATSALRCFCISKNFPIGHPSSYSSFLFETSAPGSAGHYWYQKKYAQMSKMDRYQKGQNLLHNGFLIHQHESTPATSVVVWHLRMLGISVPIYTNITFPFTGIPLLLAPYVSRQNPTGLKMYAPPMDQNQIPFESFWGITIWIDNIL